MVSGLRARLEVVRPTFRLDVDLAVEPGEVVALVGPNGAGKSTALRALAGLIALHGGHVELDGRVLADAAQGLHRPPHERGMGVVFQDYLLFPHLSVLDNVAFGLTALGRRRPDARTAARCWLERMELAGLADARPRTLSGGQAQRVALARALATDPGLLLLDEPLAALDARTRLLVRGELRQHLQTYAGATIVITHDPVDAGRPGGPAGRRRGRQGGAEGHPSFSCRPTTHRLRRPPGRAGPCWWGRGAAPPCGSPAEVGFVSPRSSTGRCASPSGRPRSRCSPVGQRVPRATSGPGRSRDWSRTAPECGVEVAGAPDGASRILAEVTAAAVAELALRPGSPVWATVKAPDIAVYPDGAALAP